MEFRAKLSYINCASVYIIRWLALQNKLVNWYWTIDVNTDEFVLNLSNDIKFPTFFSRKQLLTLPQQSLPFTTEDAVVYSHFRELLALTQLTPQAQFSIAVNGTAVCNYLAAYATKSWLFETIGNKGFCFTCGDIVETEAKSTGYYLVLDGDEQTSTIMLLSEQQQIDTNRVFNQGQVLRVHNDRLEKKSELASLPL